MSYTRNRDLLQNDYNGTRDILKGLLHGSGLTSVQTSKAHSPSSLPCGIVSLIGRHGEVKLVSGFANQRYKFEIHIVVNENENSDEELMSYIEKIDEKLQETYFTEIERVEFYESLLSSKNIKVARFEVTI
jgi:uncharacterized NAD(P)/FAD-binding protein YdhS